MKSPTRLKPLVTTLASLTVALCAAAPAWALLPAVRTGLFGVARGQVARISLVNLAERGTLPLQVDLRFVDVLGNVVASETKTVIPGQASSFDFSFNSFLIDSNRVELRAVVSEHNPPDDLVGRNPTAIRPIATSIEVFDADSGKTVFILQNPAGLRN